MEKSRIGLFGGTFNPVHSGHIRAAVIVLEQFSMEKILFVPSSIPPHKESDEIASPYHRLQMVKLACSPYPRFVPSSLEIEAEEKSYSIITLKKVKRLFPEALVYFILGVDAFLEIETWKEYEELINQCFFIVVSRPGYRLDEARDVLRGKYRDSIRKYAGLEVKRGEDLVSPFRIFLLAIDALDIASSKIRQMVREGASIRGLVPEEVERYIEKHKIYQRKND